jgi:hypothetical protein
MQDFLVAGFIAFVVAMIYYCFYEVPHKIMTEADDVGPEIFMRIIPVDPRFPEKPYKFELSVPKPPKWALEESKKIQLAFSAPKAAPNPDCQSSEEGPNRFRDCSDDQVGEWAIEEAGKIDKMARESIIGVTTSQQYKARTFFFSSSLRQCCETDVKDLRAVILRRLGPPSKNVKEEDAWRIMWPELAFHQLAGGDSFQTSRVQPLAVQAYVPYLNWMGAKLKRRGKPRFKPTALSFSQTKVATDKPNAPYIVTIKTKMELAFGYVVIQFTGTADRLNDDLDDSRRVSQIADIENPELKARIESSKQASYYILRIGVFPFSPSRPINIMARGAKKFHTSSVMFFDE